MFDEWSLRENVYGSCSDIMMAGGLERTRCSTWSVVMTVKVDRNAVTKLTNSYNLWTSGFWSRLLYMQYVGMRASIMSVILFHEL